MLAVSVFPAVVARFRSLASSLERRSQQRKYGPRKQLTLKIEGRRYVTTDWSLGGAKLGGFDQPPKRGTLLEGRLGGIRGVKGEFLAKVMHVNDNGEVALQWDEMSSSCYAALATVPRY
jgi:hypothetical protein